MKNILSGILIIVIVIAFSCKSNKTQEQAAESIFDKEMTDEELLDLVQEKTFRLFYDFAHRQCGLAYERTNFDAYGGRAENTMAVGGSGFGFASFPAAVERGWITRNEAVERLLFVTEYLKKADKFHGAMPHWYWAPTGKVEPFGANDNGGDLVETAYMIQGLLICRQYFTADSSVEIKLRENINELWNGVEWDWYTRGEKVLYWHWSPDKGWIMNHQIHGWNECLITYVLAASSKTHAIDAEVYHQGWTNSDYFYNGKTYFDSLQLQLGFDYGGPLFFAHYSFLGIDPRGLSDKYADYWLQNVNHTKINRMHCIKNPGHFKGYGEDCWGLTASDNFNFYGAHQPTEDLGVITPSAALSSMPYTPEYSKQAMRHFFYTFRDKLWGPYGFYDAFSESKNWWADHYLSIDQGPIVGMIENYRTGLLWDLFMSCPEIQEGMKKLDFESPQLK